MASYVSMYNKSKSNRRSAYYDDQNRFKEEEERKEQERQRAQIEQQYQTQMAQNNKRGALDRVFDVLSTPGFMTNGFLQDGFTGVIEGAKAGLDGFALNGKEYGKEYSFEDTLGKATGGAWSDWEPEKWYGKTGKFLVNLAGEIATDPTSYLTGASIAKSITKGTGKRLGKETVEAVTEEAIKKSGNKIGKEIGDKAAQRYAEKANKILGNKTSIGNVKFAGMELQGSGDVLRKLGDSTVAPTLNSIGDALRFSSASKLVDTASPIRQTMKAGNLDEFTKLMHTKDSITAMRKEKFSTIMNFGGEAKKHFDNLTEEERKLIPGLIENENSWEKVYTNLNPNDVDKQFFDEFITWHTKGEGIAGMGKVNSKQVFDELLTAERPFEVMKAPKDKYTEFVYKSMIEQSLGKEFKNYQEAYTSFVNNFTIKHKEMPKAKPKLKRREDIQISKYMDKPLSDLDRETGLFINTKNLEKYQTLFSNNKAMTTLVGLNPKRKIEYLNGVLFDGKPFIQLPTDRRALVKLEGQLNGIFKHIKAGADEGELFNALQGLIDLDNIDKNFLNTDIYLSSQELAEITPDVLNQLDKSSTQRIYNAETRELAYSLDKEGLMKKRDTPYAEELRIAKQAKLQQVTDVVTGNKSIAEANLSEPLAQQKEEVINMIKDTDIFRDYEVRTTNVHMTDDIIFSEETMYKDGIPVYKNANDDFRDLEYGEIEVATTVQKAMDDIAQGKIDTPEVKDVVLRADAQEPIVSDLNEMYIETRIDEATGKTYKTTYDPYTRETKQTELQVRIAQDYVEQAMQNGAIPSKLDHYLNVAYNDKSITDLFNNYMENYHPDSMATGRTGNNMPYVVKNGELFVQRVDFQLKQSDVTLSKDMQNTIEFVMKEFSRMGMSERQSGKLRTMINNYVPHILNQDLLKNPKFLASLKQQDPELYRTVFMHAGDKFNKHGIGRSELLEQKVKELLTSKYAKEGIEYQGKGKTIADVNEALKPMLEKAGFDGDFFLTDMYDIFTARAKSYGEVVYSDKFVDDTLEQFGKFIRPEMIQDEKTYYLNQKNIRDVFDGLDDKTQLLMMQEMGLEFDKVYNKMLVEVKGKDLEKFYKASEKYGNTMITAFEMPDYVIQMCNQNGYTERLNDTNAFLKVYDKFTNLWKQSATVINPGFHLRNKFSNTFQNFLAIGSDVFNKERRNAVKAILGGADGELVTDGGKIIPFQAIRDELVARDVLSFQDFDLEKRQVKAHTLFGDELGNVGSGGIAEAIARKVGADDPTMFNRIDPTDSANFMGYTAGRKLGSTIEDFDRTLNFVSNVMRDMDFDTAQDMVNHFLFDYSDLTGFESSVMKRIVPFYTWLRKNAPLQIEQLTEKPWLYAGIADLHRESTRDKDTSGLPEYMQDWIGLPIKWTLNGADKDMYINPNMPYQDLGKDFSDPKELFGMLNPFIKLPIELGMNHNTFFDSPIANDIDEMPEQYAKHIGNTLGGAWNTIGKGIGALGSGDLEQIMSSTGSLATGVKVKTHDANKAQEDAIYRAIRAMEEDLALQKSTKNGFNQSFEEYKKTKLEKYGYK